MGSLGNGLSQRQELLGERIGVGSHPRVGGRQLPHLAGQTQPSSCFFLLLGDLHY